MIFADLTTWVILSFVSGSVPWSVILVRYISGKNIRDVGDGNPGAINAWKTSGTIVGMCAMVLEIAKSFIPVWLSMNHLSDPDDFLGHIQIFVLLIAPIIGHAWSPFLRFRGGKALAPMWGVWIAITNGYAFLAGLLFLGIMHLFQKNHAMTVTVCLIGFFVSLYPLFSNTYLLLFWPINLAIMIYKHRSEYSNGVEMRAWVHKLTRVRG